MARDLRRLAGGPAALNRASSGLVVVTAIAAVGGMLLTTQQAIDTERFTAETARARAVAGYLSLVVPWDAVGYQPARLLSTANTVRNSGFWSGGLQVASGETGLLSDSLALSPLPDDVHEALAQGAVKLERPGTGPIAVVPLLDPALRDRAGWVATWDALGAGRWTVPALVLACLTLAGALVARWLPLATIASGVFLAAVLWLSVRSTAREGTDVVLLTARRLAEISSSPEGARVPLDRLGPGLQWSVRRGVAPRDGQVRRRRIGGRAEATVVASLAGGRVAEITTAPRESRLGPVALALAGWTVLLGTGIGIGARAARRPAR